MLEFSPDGSTTASGSDGGNAIGFLSGASAFYTQQLSSRVSVGLGDFSDFGLAFEYDSGAGPTPSRSASA